MSATDSARRATKLALAILVALLLVPASAGAHAYVVKTSPASGVVVKTQPARVTVVWDEAITVGSGGAQAALGVFDAKGARVDSGDVQHPVGDTLSVGLKPDLP